VDAVVPAVELMTQAMVLAEELATREPTAFAAIKRELRANAMARIATHAPGADPVWDVWRAPATRAAVEAYRARTLAKDRA
jgi:hypothetical protein